jgi:hypothetical protein
MANLCASMEPWRFEGQLVDALSPAGGVQTLYSLVSRLLSSATPVIARNPGTPMEKGADGLCTGLYWSRALNTPIAVGLAPVRGRQDDQSGIPSDLVRLLPASVVPDRIESVRERNVQGWVWELPGFSRSEFPG